ncbi:hypothetical protein ACE34P_003502 [Vibrio fluvialis]
MKDKNVSLIRNTLFLLVKLIFSMIVNLYLSREILSILGVEDYGIYNVVNGAVIMITLLTGSLSSAVTRFINFEMGKKNIGKIRMIFSASNLFHFLLAIIVCLFGMVFSEQIIKHWLNIPLDRQDAALVVLYLSCISFGGTLLSISYTALIIAYEEMKTYTIIGINELFLKLVCVYILLNVQYDKLVLHACLLTVVVFVNLFIYIIYCKIRYHEIKFTFTFDKVLIKDILAFIGWNSVGSGSFIFKDQGVNILINIFFGATTNTARALSYQIGSAVNSVVSHLMLALNPRITKLYASGKEKDCIELSCSVARYSFFLTMCLGLPIISQSENLIRLWLSEVPAYTSTLLQLIIINMMIDSLSGPLITMMLATGNIRNYQLVVGITNALNFPISFILLSFGLGVEFTMYTSISISIVNLYLRLKMLSKIMDISIIYFYTYVIKKVLSVFIFSLLSSYSIFLLISKIDLKSVIYQLASGTILMLMVQTAIVIFFGLEKVERNYFLVKISNVWLKINEKYCNRHI